MSINLKQLKKSVDFIYNQIEEPEKVGVYVTLEEPSIGARAKSDVISCNMGFDWEAGQFRIATKDKLVRKDRDRLSIIPIKQRLSFDNTRKIYCCPICDNKISKIDKFCRFCGQRMA